MRGPLHPQLAHLERAYMTIRNEVADGRISDADASSTLREGAVVDREGHRWWVDFETSTQSAQFFSDRTGIARLADPSDFRHTSPTAVPANPAEAANASRLYMATATGASVGLVDLQPSQKEAVEDTGKSAREKSVEKMRDITDRNDAVEQAYAAVETEEPRTVVISQLPRVFYIIPALVVAFIGAVMLFSGSDTPNVVADTQVEETTTTVEVATTTEAPQLVFDPETGLASMPTG